MIIRRTYKETLNEKRNSLLYKIVDNTTKQTIKTKYYSKAFIMKLIKDREIHKNSLEYEKLRLKNEITQLKEELELLREYKKSLYW